MVEQGFCHKACGCASHNVTHSGRNVLGATTVVGYVVNFGGLRCQGQRQHAGLMPLCHDL